MNQWRLIIHPPYEGAWNMAVDESILESTSNKNTLPTLRLYDWNPFALSLGHAQPAADVDLATLDDKHWSLVRRPTGGRAILHADELTYSVCAPIDDPIVKGSILESYHRISRALIRGLEIIGVKTESTPKNQSESHLSRDPVCFQYPSDYEITSHNKKLIGSAQARKKNGVLQHGAIPIFGDITRIISVLAFVDEQSRKKAKANLSSRATTIEKSIKKNISWFQLADAICEGFKESLEISFSEEQLTKQELSRAFQIYKEKYANKEWTYRI